MNPKLDVVRDKVDPWRKNKGDHRRHYLDSNVLVPLSPKISVFAREDFVKSFVFVLNEIGPNKYWQNHCIYE